MYSQNKVDSRLPYRIALIGAGGFLGTNLAQYMAPLVEELRCFGRSQSFPDAMRDLHWISGDTTLDPNSAIDDALTGCDTVVHLASTSSPSTANQNIPTDAQDNVISSLQLLDRCVAAGIKRVVFISSGGTVYGIPKQIPITESAPTLPINAYGAAKLAIEKYMEVYSHLYNLDYRVLRISNIYGPLQTVRKQQGVVAAFLAGAIRGEPLEIWGDGLVVRDYVYVKDIAEAIISAIVHKGKPRIFNIGSGVGLSLIDVITSIEQILDKQLEKTFKPTRPVDVPINILDCQLADLELGWAPNTSFHDGLQQTIEWMKTHLSATK